MHHGELENQGKMWQKLLDIGHKLHGVKLTNALRGLRQSDVKVSVEEDQHLVDKLETGAPHGIGKLLPASVLSPAIK